MTNIPVLMYHALDSPQHPAGSKDSGEQLYVLDVTIFEGQLNFLKENGYRTVLLEDVLSHTELPPKTLVLTFDDGHVSNYTLALPLLLKYDFVAEFFITTGRMGEENYLSKAQIKELSVAGMGIGSHGVTHDYLDGLSEDAIRDELGSSKKQLENILGKSISSFSAPGGRMNKAVKRIGHVLGYRIQCSSKIGLVQSGKIKTIPRVALKRTLNDYEFRQIVEGNWFYYFKNKARYQILSMLKFIIGNRLYSRLHIFVSKIR